jgi:hypothetical protein
MFHFDTIGCTTITGECSECLEKLPKTTKMLLVFHHKTRNNAKRDHALPERHIPET